jgi:copper transport protein
MFPEGTNFLSVCWQLLQQTRWGVLWLVRQITLLVLIWVIWRGSTLTDSKYRLGWEKPFAALLLLILMTMQSLGSHAASVTPRTELAIAADTLHLVAASAWIGGLVALVFCIFPLIRKNKAEPGSEPHTAALLHAGWGAFSRLAAISVGILFATGLYSASRQVASLDALISTLYGQSLSTKVGLVLLVGGIGLLNSVLLHPRLAFPLAWILRRPVGWTPLPLKRLLVLIPIEAGISVLVLLFSGIITSTPPARGAEFIARSKDIPNSMNQQVDDLIITFAAQPNLPGQNVFTLRAVSSRRPPAAEILRVIVNFTYQGQEAGTVSTDAEIVEAGVYRLGGSYLSLPGPWKVDVVVRRKGIEDSVAHFNWIVAAPGSDRAVIISQKPIGPALSLAAGVIMILVLMLSIGAWLLGHQNTLTDRG